MDDDRPQRKIKPAKAEACRLWAPVIPPRIAKADSGSANTTILHDAQTGSDALSQRDLEEIESR